MTGARMRSRSGGAVAAAGLALVLTVMVTACSGGTTGGHGAVPHPTLPTGSGTLGTPTAQCAQLAAAVGKVITAQTALYTGDQHALADLDATLQGIRASTPADVQAAIDRLITAFHTAADLLEHPTASDKQKLTVLAPQMASDEMTVSQYATSTCGH